MAKSECSLSRSVLGQMSGSHPGASILFRRPRKQAYRKFLFWYVPLRVVLVFVEPRGDLLYRLLVVDFDDHKRPLNRKKPRAAAEDFVLTPLHVYLDQLRQGSAGSDEIIQCDCRNPYGFAARQNGVLPIVINATLRLECCTATKGNSIAGSTRPYGGMNHFKAAFQSVPRTVAPQAFDVFGISIKSNNTAEAAHKPGRAKGYGSDVGANVIDNSTRPNCGKNCILHDGFMLSSPEVYFFRKTTPHPQSLGQPRLNSDPDICLSEQMALDQPLKPVEPSSYTGPSPQHAFCSRLPKNGVHSINQNSEVTHFRFQSTLKPHAAQSCRPATKPKTSTRQSQSQTPQVLQRNTSTR